MLNRRDMLRIGMLSLARPRAARGSFGLGLPDADEIDRMARRHVDSGKTAGLAIGVRNRDIVTLCRTYGFSDVAAKTQLDSHSVFRIASVTKTFTAIAILKLSDQKKLTLDDPVARFLPSFPRAAEVTIRQLLSHTSGVHDYVFGGLPPGPSKHWTTADEFVSRLARVQPLFDFDPGTRFSYSNSGYILLGAVIEKASGDSYEAFLNRSIFAPLGMRDTAVDHTGEIVPNRAPGYNLRDKQPGEFVLANDDGMLPFSAGAIRSSLVDLLAWQQALFAGKLVSRGDVQQMTSPARTSDGRLVDDARWFPAGIHPQRPDFLASDNYGLGLETAVAYGHKGIGHDGGINGYNSIVEHFPDDEFDIILLANTSNGAVELWLQLLNRLGSSG